MSARARTALFALLIAPMGCALTSKSEPVPLHYFEPRPVELGEGTVTTSSATMAPCALALGRVTASEDLGESIAYRSSPYEIGYYDTRHWTERPDNYLRRALAHALFEQRGCRRIVSGVAPSLDVELFAFEQQRGPPETARVAVHMILAREDGVLHEETITAVRPVPASGGREPFERFVFAISQALADVVQQIAARVDAALH